MLATPGFQASGLGEGDTCVSAPASEGGFDKSVHLRGCHLTSQILHLQFKAFISELGMDPFVVRELGAAVSTVGDEVCGEGATQRSHLIRGDSPGRQPTAPQQLFTEHLLRAYSKGQDP